MTKEPKGDPEQFRVGQAIARLRERAGLTQAQAAAAIEDNGGSMSPQYWGMHENGQVAGIFRPNAQRKLLDAIGCTLEDLEAELASGEHTSRRMGRMARELSPGPDARRLALDAEQRTATFPLSEGNVTLTFPSDLSPAGYKELKAYLELFLATLAPAEN